MIISDSKGSKEEVKLLENFIYETMLPEILKSKKDKKIRVQTFDYKELFRTICKCGEEVQPPFVYGLREDIINSAYYSVLDELSARNIILKLPTDYSSSVDVDEIIKAQVKHPDMQRIFKFMEKVRDEKGYYELDMHKYVSEELTDEERTFENEERLYGLVNQMVQVLFKSDIALCVCDELYSFDKGLCDIERATRDIFKNNVENLQEKIKQICAGEDVLNGGFYDKEAEETLKTIYKLLNEKYKDTKTLIEVNNDRFAVVDSNLLKKSMKECAVGALERVADEYLMEDQVVPFLKKYSKLYSEVQEQYNNDEEPKA